MIVFQDIAPDHFEMIHQPTNLTIVTKIVKKLAKFHALSTYMHDERPDSVARYVDGFGSEAMLKSMMFLKENFDSFAQLVAEWGGEFVEISAKLMAMKDQFGKRIADVYRPSKRFSVLNHGDFHIKNILFRHGATKEDVEEIRLVRS